MIEEERGRPARRFAYAYGLANVAGVLSYYPVVSLFLPLKVSAIAPDDRFQTLALLSGIGALVASAANILFGALSDRSFLRHGSRRRWLCAGIVAPGIAYALLAAAHDRSGLIAAVIAFQLAVNLLLAPLGAMLADEVADEDKGFAGGLLALGPPAASLFGGLIIASELPEAHRYAVLAGLVALLAMPMLLLRPSPPQTCADAASSAADLPRDLAFLWIGRLAMQTAAVAILTYGLFYFERRDGGDPATVATRVALLSGAARLAAVPAGIAIGILSDRLDRRVPILIGAAFCAALGLVLMAFAQSWLAGTPGYLAFALGSSVFAGLHMAFTAQLLCGSPRHRGRDLGLFNLTNTVPALLAPALLWWLVEERGDRWFLLALAIITLGGAAATARVRERR